MNEDGGPAFPQPREPSIHIRDGETVMTTEGMSLRDWFAGMALQGILAMSIDDRKDLLWVNDDEYHEKKEQVIAIEAYILADAMLKQRTT